MRESLFVEKNAKKWKEVENGILSDGANPEQIREQFIQVTDDLAYARTFYKNRSIRVYLNNLAQNLHNKLQSLQPRPYSFFKSFWMERVPLVAYESRKMIYLAFIIFFIGVGFGVLSCMESEDFPRAFFGDAYVDKTIENIEDGDPLGVYKSSNELEMFAGITINNLRVAFMAFGLGILFSVGGIYILLFNSIMLGTFIFFFYSRGLAYEFNSVVWLHGAVEISSMVVECAAGMLLGNAILFPKTYTRRQSLFLAGRKGITLMIALTPMIILAGFIESFITRHTEWPDIIRWLIIGVTFFGFVYYFLVYPVLKYRKNKPENVIFKDLYFERKVKLNLQKEDSIAVTLNKVIRAVMNKNKAFLLVVGVGTVLLFAVNYLCGTASPLSDYQFGSILNTFDPFTAFFNVFRFVGKIFLPLHVDVFSSGPEQYKVIGVILYVVFLFVGFEWLRTKLNLFERGAKPTYGLAAIRGMLLALIFIFIGQLHIALGVVFVLAGFMTILVRLIPNVVQKGELGIILSKKYFKLFFNLLFSGLVMFILFVLLLSPLFWSLVEFLKWLTPTNIQSISVMQKFFVFLLCLIINIGFTSLLLTTTVLLYGIRESLFGHDLKKQVDIIGN